MKQKLLLLSATFFVSIMGFAQWTKPVPKGTDLVMGDLFYLYNVEAGGFLVGANEWDTRASVSPVTGHQIVITAAPNGEDGNVMINNYVPTKEGFDAIDCQGFGNIWVDGSGRAGYDMWRVTKEGQYYVITNDDVEGTFGMAELTASGQGEYVANNRLFMYQSDATFGYDYEGEYFEIPFFSGNFYDKWIFVAPAEYDALISQLSTYDAAMKLKAAIDAAKAEYPNVDFSVPTAVYNNFDATAEELVRAEQLVSVIINEYRANQATFDDPMDFTDIIGDGSSVDPWTRDFTGNGTVGSHNTNTWSTEANNGADGTDMTTPFIEHWTGAGGFLSDQKIYQMLYNALPGLYKLTINARVYNEASKLDKFEGISMYFGDKNIDLQEQTSITYLGNKSVLWKPDYFTIVAVVQEAGDIEFGFEIKDANFNWLAFKNTSLLYYGNENVEENAKKLLGESSDLEKVPADTRAKAELIKAYNDAVDAYNKATSLEEASAAAETAQSAKVVLDANIAAYDKLFEKIEEWEEYVAEHNDLEGEDWEKFAGFILTEDDIEGYPTPSVGAIKEADTYTLETAEIEAYITTIDKLYAHAIAASLVPGADCTNMLVNPSFSTGDFTGWTYRAGSLGNKNVECFQTVVDIYQVVEDVPDGIYSISVQAFERPGGNGSYDGSEASKVFLFMNQFQTPVQNICADVVAVEDAIPGKIENGQVKAYDGYEGTANCYLDGGTTAGAWPYDYELFGQGYIPNSVDGARIAFEAGRYVQKCYGIVENGEMKIGLTSNGQRVEWVLWANFKLTYEGKSAEALAGLLPTYIENLNIYIEEHELSDPGRAAAEQAVADAEKAIQDGSADAMWDALLAINAAMKAAKDNTIALDNCYNATIALENAIYDFEETASAEAKKYATTIQRKADDYYNLTTEEIEALIAEINKAIAALRVPQTDGATFENWVDMTCVIVNPDFETWNTDGWTLAIGAQNLGFQNNASYSNGDDPEAGVISNFIEAWRPSVELGDGEISQVIYSLPAGVYALDADIIVSWQNDPDLDVEGVYLFAQEGDDAWRCIPLSTANGIPEHFTNYFVKKSADTPLTIGIGVRGTNANWIAADNFTMKFFGSPNSENENCVDMTSMIVNPDMETGNANGWVFTIDALNRGFMGNSYSNPFDENNTTISNFIEAWNPNIPFNDGEILQVINTLPAGIYSLDADIIATWQNDPELAVEGVYLFAQEGDDAWQCVPLATANGVPEHFTNYFVKKSADTPLTIGVGVRNTNANWIAADNFTMTFFGSPNQIEIKNYLAINDAKAFVGKQITVPVELINDSEITGVEFDLLLPEGITLEKCKLAGREEDHSIKFSYNEEKGTYKVLIVSLSSYPFIGDEGTLLNLVLNVDATMEEGLYGYGIMNAKLVTPDEKTFTPADTYAAFFISNTLRGDANGDGVVDVTDVVSVVNYILNRPSDKFNFNAADVNSDGTVDITDVVGVVNIILQKGVNAAKSRDMEVLSNALMMLNEHDGMNVFVEDAAKFAAMQFDVVVADNANLLDAILNSSSDHQIGFAKLGANRYRVLAYSTDNDSFQPTEDALIQLVLSNGNATIENATFVAADGRSVQMIISGDATSIAGISSESQKDAIYNMAGQRVGTSLKSLPAGIYIRNGKKIKVK